MSLLDTEILPSREHNIRANGGGGKLITDFGNLPEILRGPGVLDLLFFDNFAFPPDVLERRLWRREVSPPCLSPLRDPTSRYKRNVFGYITAPYLTGYGI
jgi:hypothetical protein